MGAARRFHAFDALRAAAMELGLVLHAGVPYTQACPASWVVCDVSRSGAFDLLNTLIHAFRMPVFFLMSGFFAVLLYERVGPRAYLRHRVRRLVIPLLVAAALLVPVTRAVWIYGAFARPLDPVEGAFGASLRAHFRDEGLRIFETIWHLWFLEYLILYTAVFLVVQLAFGPRLRTARWLDVAAGRRVGRGRALWLAVPTALAMLPMQGWNVDGIGELVPAAHMLAYYAIFFVAGALLHRARDRVEDLARGWRLHLALAGGLVLPGMMFAIRLVPEVSSALSGRLDVAGRVASALLTTLLLYGVVGLFVERFARDSAVQRYLSDTAYFVYLTHFPLIAFLGVLLAGLALPAPLKFAVVLGVAVPTLLAVYQLGVRHSFVGRALHGAR